MSNPTLFNMTKLRFGSIDEYKNYYDVNNYNMSLIWLWHERIGNKNSDIEISCICDLCNNISTFTTRPQAVKEDEFEYRADWAALVCGNCGFDTRDRTIITHVRDNIKSGDVIYHVGHHSTIARHLMEEYPATITSQYEPGKGSGSTDERGIRYEDLTSLSFGSKSFDKIICSEVLEHIADYKTSLLEIARVLRDGGEAILTFPWLGGHHYEHTVRAEMMPNGNIVHYLPPEYHRDPASSDGILSFRAFGWAILDDLRAAGFGDAAVHYKFAPLHGYMTLLHPIIVATK